MRTDHGEREEVEQQEVEEFPCHRFKARHPAVVGVRQSMADRSGFDRSLAANEEGRWGTRAPVDDDHHDDRLPQ